MEKTKLTLTGLDSLRWLEAQGAKFCKVAAWNESGDWCTDPGKQPFPTGWQNKPLTTAQVTTHFKNGGNVGLLPGTYSGDDTTGHIYILDADEDYSKFCSFFDWAAIAPTIVKEGPDKGKALIRGIGPLLKGKKFRHNPTDKHPFFELLACGNQGVIAGKHPTGPEYTIINAENGIPIFTTAGINAICEAWTGQSLDEFAKAKYQERQAQAKDTRQSGGDGLYDAVTAYWTCQKVFERFNRAGEIRKKGEELKLGGNGGLYVDPEGNQWYCFSSDMGGGPFQAWQYCESGNTNVPTGRGFYDLLCKMASAANIPIPAKPDTSKMSVTIQESEMPPIEGTTEQPTVKTFADMAGMIGPVDWDWRYWLVKGMLTILAGESGAGKSGLGLRVAGCYTNAWPWPDGTPFTGSRGAVLWCEAEAAQAVNLERAKAWGLPLDQLYTPLPNPLDDLKLDLEGHRVMLAQKAALPEVKLIVIDSLRGILGRGDENASDTLNFIKWLAELARDTGKPIILTHHLRKRSIFDNEGVELERLRGSSAIVQTARVVWALDVPDPAAKESKRLAVIKSNLAKFPDPVGMTIDENGVHFGNAPQPPKNETAADKAVDLLLDLLGREPRPYSEIEEAYHAAGLSEPTINRAKKSLGIISIRQGENRNNMQWYWSLPAKEEDTLQ